MAADIVCSLDSESEQALNRLLNSENILSSVVLKCSMRTAQISLDEEFDRLTPEQLVDDANLAGEMRIVVYKCGWKVPSDPHGKVVSSQMLLWFNPAETSDIALKRTYGPTVDHLARIYASFFKRSYQINNASDFTKTWLESQNYSLELKN